MLLTYWNTVAFHSLYARAARWTPSGEAPPVAERHVLDQWLTSATQRLIVDATESLEAYDTQRYGRALAGFIDALSELASAARAVGWNSEPRRAVDAARDARRADEALGPDHAVRHRARLAGPVLRGRPGGSVVGAPGALADGGRGADRPALSEAMERPAAPSSSAALGARRVEGEDPPGAGPDAAGALSHLREALSGAAGRDQGGAERQALESFASAGDLVDPPAKGNFRNLGKRFAKRTPLVAKAIAELDASWLAEQLRDAGRAVMPFDGEDVEATADDVIVTERPREGWSVVNEQGETVALDLELTPELIRSGLAREVIRFVQEARKRAGLDISDYIALVVESGPELAEAVAAHRDLIAAEVLAVELIQDEVDAPTDEDQELNLRIAGEGVTRSTWPTNPAPAPPSGRRQRRRVRERRATGEVTEPQLRVHGSGRLFDGDPRLHAVDLDLRAERRGAATVEVGATTQVERQVVRLQDHGVTLPGLLVADRVARGLQPVQVTTHGVPPSPPQARERQRRRRGRCAVPRPRPCSRARRKARSAFRIAARVASEREVPSWVSTLSARSTS